MTYLVHISLGSLRFSRLQPPKSPILGDLGGEGSGQRHYQSICVYTVGIEARGWYLTASS